METAEKYCSKNAPLLKRIFPIISEKGPAHTTMDDVARSLSMSKRTLYEIFGNKDQMLEQVFAFFHHEYFHHVNEIFRTSDNVMEGMSRAITFHRQVMKKLNVDFFRDMDLHHHKYRVHYERESKHWETHLLGALHKGIRQGYFRSDLEYNLVFSLLRVQMESLKRMEKYFPPEITIDKAFYVIGDSFLRSIATEKGVRTLESLKDKHLPLPEIFAL